MSSLLRLGFTIIAVMFAAGVVTAIVSLLSTQSEGSSFLDSSIWHFLADIGLLGATPSILWWVLNKAVGNEGERQATTDENQPQTVPDHAPETGFAGLSELQWLFTLSILLLPALVCAILAFIAESSSMKLKMVILEKRVIGHTTQSKSGQDNQCGYRSNLRTHVRFG